jgi:hypothetical protein
VWPPIVLRVNYPRFFDGDSPRPVVVLIMLSSTEKFRRLSGTALDTFCS